MGFSDLTVALMADLLAGMEAVMNAYVQMPANATGPLDPNIVLTSLGTELVNELARLGIAWSGTLAATCELLV